MINPFAWLWQDRRITTVVTVTMALVIALAVTVITVLDVSRQQKIFESQLEEKGLALSRTLNDVLANSLYFRDMEKLRQLANVATAQPEIVGLTIFAPNGRILIGPGDEKYPVGSVSPEAVQIVNERQATDIRFLEDYVEFLTPVVVSGETIGGVRFHFNNAALAASIEATVVEHIWQGALVMLLGVVLSYLFAQSIVRPVRNMVDLTDRIAAGDFEISIEQNRRDEIGVLARSLESMTRRLREAERLRAEEQNAQLREANQQLQNVVAERMRAQQESEQSRDNLQRALEELRQTQQKLVQQERLSAVGQMSSGIAHDINNRLQIILGLSDRLLLTTDLELDGEETRQELRMIRDSVRDAADVVNLLRDFYRPKQDMVAMEPVDLANVVKAAVQLTEPRWKDQAQSRGLNLHVLTDVPELPAIEGRPGELREALINLLFNAIDALPEGGDITICGFSKDEDIVLEVRDNGVGMAPAVRQRCMEPFFTTSKDGTGSGLGLAMVYRTVKRHGGGIEIDSLEGQGTTIRIRLPRHRRAETARANDDGPTQVSPLDVLVIDDEPMVRKLITALLEHDGHRVVTAANGSQGLESFRDGSFDLVISDRAMPDMNGDEVAGQIKSKSPLTPVIMLTGFGGLMNASGEAPRNVDLILAKPIRHADLTAAIARVMQTGGGSLAGQESTAAG